MANDKKVVEKGKHETAKKEMIKRTNEDLKKGGIKGTITLLAKFAFKKCSDNEFVGVDLGGREPKYVAYPVVKAGGVIDRMDENSEDFKKVRAAAKLALPDLQGKDAKYSPNVKAFVKTLLAVELPRTHSMNNSILEGITL